MSKNTEKIVINVQKPGKNRQKYRKMAKMSKNTEKIVINVQKLGKNRQKYRKTVKNVKKTGEKNQKCAKTR